MLSHATKSVNVPTTVDESTPYLTLRVPLNAQVPFSLAHSIQPALDGLVVGVVDVTEGATVTDVVAPPSAVEAAPPPHAATNAADRTTQPPIAALCS